MEHEKIQEAIKKAKEIVEKMSLEEPYKSLTYKTLLDRFLSETTREVKETPLVVKGTSDEIPQIKNKNNFRQAILELLSSSWGIIPRTAGEIKEALELNALYMESSAIAATLIQMTKSNKLRRIKKGELFAYVLSKRD
jgi:hypothetical protein